jgi:cytochrome c6
VILHRLTGDNSRYRCHLIAALLVASAFISNAAIAGNVFNGKSLYATYCQSCHGESGRGSLSGTPNFTRGLSLMKPDARLFDSIDSGRNAMPAFRGVLKDEEIYDLITYIRSFY